jgi:hypothetical protein
MLRCMHAAVRRRDVSAAIPENRSHQETGHRRRTNAGVHAAYAV